MTDTQGRPHYLSRNVMRDILEDLVRALDKTSWSSWQTTAPFDKELDRARTALSNTKE